MARVEVVGCKMNGETLVSLDVRLHGLPARTLDRDTVVAWMRDGHSFIPLANGEEAPAMRLVEAQNGDEVSYFVRSDGGADPADCISM